MRLTVLFLLASVVFPSVSDVHAPVFEFTKIESTMKFDVKASVAIVDLQGKRVSGPPVVFKQ